MVGSIHKSRFEVGKSYVMVINDISDNECRTTCRKVECVHKTKNYVYFTDNGALTKRLIRTDICGEYVVFNFRHYNVMIFSDLE